MVAPVFTKAVRRQARARVAIDGPSGAGKTYTALVAATELADGKKIAVIDTERGSASLYADEFNFDVLELNPPFEPKFYIEALEAAEKDYAVIVIDSLSHAWEGEGGVLDMHDAATKRQRTENSYTAWKDVTPMHRKLVDSMLQSPAHIIATMRSKMEYSQEKNADGKTVIRKIGMAPIQRQGMEYEFTIVGDMDVDHNLVISKSRCKVMADAVVNKPDRKFFKTLREWLNSGDAAPAPAQTKQPETHANTTNSTTVERPLIPETLRSMLALKATKKNGEASPEQLGLMVSMMELAFAGNADADKIRRSCLRYLWGVDSSKKLNDPQIKATLDWLKPQKDTGGSYQPDEMAVKELHAVWTAANVEAGQGTLI